MALAPFVSDVQLSPQNLREKNMELRKSIFEGNLNDGVTHFSAIY